MRRPLRAGESWVLTVDADRGYLWRCVGAAASNSQAFAASLNGADAHGALECSERALTWSVPLLWAPLRRPEPLQFTFESATPRLTQLPPRVIQGRSCGLGLLVARSSRVFGLPPAEDVFASATVDDAGELGAVEGISLKLDAIRGLTDRPKVVVHRDQQLSHRDHDGLEVHRFEHARDALPLFFPGLVDHMLARPDVATDLFDFASGQRDVIPCWRPVAEAARVVGETQRMRDGVADWGVRYAEAIAARHYSNSGTIELPSQEWLDRQPTGRQRLVYRQLVQQAADSRCIDPDEVRRWAEARLDPRMKDEDDLRLAGAMARLDAATGHFEDALRRARDCAERWWRHGGMLSGEASFALCVWLRLSGALADHDAFRAADALAASYVEAFPGSRGWVDFARAYGHLGMGEPEEAARLQEGLPRANLPDRASLQRLRGLIALRRKTGSEHHTVASTPVLAARPSAFPGQSGADDAQVLLLRYAESRAALAPDSSSLIEGLRAAQPGLFGNLRQGHERSSRGLELADYLERFWSY